MTSRVVKRAFDAAVAALALIVLAPLFALVAIAVKLDSRGPVFFKQERVGRGGRPFRMIKFRTMVAERAWRGPNVSAHQDPRVTRIGSLLRRSFVDEAPQLINVLKGDMSLVGPRPETPEYALLLTPEERRILSVRPGMAGPSTLAYSRDEPAILARHEDPDSYYRNHLLHDRVAVDLAYLERPTVVEDIRILALTCVYVLAGLTGLALARPPADEELAPQHDGSLAG
jgi:lipopolysaccharide/colanic/teichoic acid biosynthesis glycosyltransferase